MVIEVINENFSFCKLRDAREVDLSNDFVFVSRTDNELSLVCPTRLVPNGTVEQEVGWKAFRIKDETDFSMVGIFSSISSVLAENLISIFAISTYETHYVFVKQDNMQQALMHLENNGYQVMQ